MKIMAWNCRGLSCPFTVQRLKQLLKQVNPQFLFLAETLTNQENISKLINPFGFSKFCGLDPEGHSGGLVLAWQDDFQVSPVAVTKHWIQLIINSQNLTWTLSGIYGPPKLCDRYILWEYIVPSCRELNHPWLLIRGL